MSDTAPSEQALQIARAIETILKPEATPAAPAAAEPTPGRPTNVTSESHSDAERQQRQAAAQAAAQQLPEGLMSRKEIDRWERLPAPKSGAEQRERLAQTDKVFESHCWHEEHGR